MSASILPVQPLIQAIVAPAAAKPGAASGSPFGTVFADAVHQVESFQKNAEASVNRFLSGEGEEIHKVALAAQQADLSFQLFLQVRNKVVAAYEEVLRMQM
ncbi:MAG TPA: flagellar hook-basal body complex protein FliE [Bryobacteraceae bacterium]|nr:flagellar hook-basal body complex protein FliE [Bryobacteraceae bacterium]